MKKSLLIIAPFLITSLLWGISLDDSISQAKKNNKQLLMAMEDVYKAEQT